MSVFAPKVLHCQLVKGSGIILELRITRATVQIM